MVGSLVADTIKNTAIENQCFQDGYIAGNKLSIDDALVYGVSLYVIVAPITYYFVGRSHPKPKSNKIEKKRFLKEKDCCFIEVELSFVLGISALESLFNISLLLFFFKSLLRK